MRVTQSLTVTIFSMLLALSAPARAETDADDPVMAALGDASQKAAVARQKDLLSDPASPVIGNPNGNVTIVEFTDYQCPYCKAAEPRLQALLKEDPNVRLVVKEFPILTKESVTASRAALASVRQGKYTAFHQAMMEHKGQITVENVFEYAKKVGLNVDQLKKDMNAPEIADQIIENLKLARAMKISVVPGLVVDTKVLSGVSNKTSTAKIDFKQEVAMARAAKK
jgi:protein-disulfide isomerase